jgi:hypothetical protein
MLLLQACEASLAMVSHVAAGISGSSKLRLLALDLDTSRADTWEKVCVGGPQPTHLTGRAGTGQH